MYAIRSYYAELRQAWQQVDELDHVNRFIEALELQKLVEQAGFKPLQWKYVQHRLHYAGLPELLKSLKGIGANQVGGRRAGGLGGRQRYASLAERLAEATVSARMVFCFWLPISLAIAFSASSYNFV